MKPEELIAQVQALINEEFREEVWLGWFNEALANLTPVLFLETYEEFTLNNEDSKLLPGDIYLIKRFVVDDGTNVEELELVEVGEAERSNEYWIWDGTAYFKDRKTGTGKLWYYRRPAKLTLGSADADIPEEYQDALILYAAAKACSPDRYLDDKNDFYRDYLNRKAEILAERQRQIASRKRIVKTQPWGGPYYVLR